MGFKQGLAVGDQNPMPVVFGASDTIPLASNVASLAAAGVTVPVTGVVGGSYIWSNQFTGASPQLILEALGPDGLTYVTVDTATAQGQRGVVIGNNATLRLRNAGAGALTNLNSTLS